MENWVANIILQLKTGKQEASIVSLIAPQKTRPLVIDGFCIWLDSTFHYFVLIMFLPLIYNYEYRIVKER